MYATHRLDLILIPNVDKVTLLEGGETTCYHFARSIQIVLEDYTNKLKTKSNFTLFSSKYIFARFDFPNVGFESQVWYWQWISKVN